VGTIHNLNTVPKVTLSAADAQRRIRGLSLDSDRVIFTDHAEERMVERDISTPEVLDALRAGYVDDTPSQPHIGEWKCKVTSRLRGRTAGVVTVIVITETS
jgi:Domain of unknown function (DUF4258)